MIQHLRDLRLALGLTQEQAAQQIGITRGILTRYEGGSRLPSVSQLMLIADFYGVSTDYLLGRTDTPQPYPPKA